MLERLERWTALHVQRHDFAVHDRLIGIQLHPCSRQSWIHPGEILVLPRTDLNAIVVLDDEGAVAVELQLVEPVVALGEALDDLRGHRRDERGRFPRWR